VKKEPLWNFRPNPGQKEWVKTISGYVRPKNDSEVLRVAIWWLQQQPDPLAIIRKYKIAMIDEDIPADFKKRVAQASCEDEKKPQG